MKQVTALGLGLLAITLFGCAPVGFGGTGAPAMGLLYMDTYGPIHTNGSIGSKEGRACAQSVFGLVATGDASIKAAARNAGITKIASVDHYTKNLLGIIAEFCTIARGN